MKRSYEPLRTLALSSAFVLLAAASGAVAVAQGPPQENQDQNIEVQTRGPVHEAFANLVTFDPEPNLEVPREPPTPIEEIPPDQRPEGDEAVWINGYWSWDDDRTDYLWVSGVWRIPPPAHTWVSGYWGRSGSGWRWVLGFWAPNQGAEVMEVNYLPPPPENLEAGPSSPSPSDDHHWTPGCWTWETSRYAWRPGTWIAANPEWIWVPASYHWTPGGHVFIEGHWDHQIERRGVLFAPVIFRGPPAAYVNYHYTPSIAVDLGVFSLHLFSRPRYNHYYFGDYYAAPCWERGIYPTFAFHMSTYGYDPFYQHRRWEHRRDVVRFEATIHAEFYRYREDEHARPAHTYVAQQAAVSISGGRQREDIVLARPVKELPAQRGSKIRLEAVPDADRKRLAVSEKQQHKAASERVKIESEVATRKSGGKDREPKPEKARIPQAPVVSRAESKNRPPANPERPKHAETDQPGEPKGKGERPAAGGKETRPPNEKPDVVPPDRSGEKPAHKRTPESNPPTPPAGKPEARPPERKPNTRPPEGKPPERRPDARPPEGKPPERKPDTRPPEGRPPERKPDTRPPEKRPPERKPETRPPDNKPDAPAPRPEPGTRPSDPRPDPTPKSRAPEGGAPPKHEPKPPAEGRKPDAPATAPRPPAAPNQPGQPGQDKPQPKRRVEPQLPKKGEKPPPKEGDNPKGKEGNPPDPKKPKPGPGG